MSSFKNRYDLLQSARRELADGLKRKATLPLKAVNPAYDVASAAGIQKILAALGYYPEEGQFDGNLHSELSVRAIRTFQGDSHLDVDGIAGEKQTVPALAKYRLFLEDMPRSFTAMRRWRLTNYYLADQARWKGRQPASVEVYDNNHKVLAKVEPYFFAEMSLEGTGKLGDGRLLNVTGKSVPVSAEMYAPVLDYAINNKFIPDRAGYAGIRIIPEGAKYKVTGALAFSEVTELGTEGFGIGQNKISYQFYKTVAADLGKYATSAPAFRNKGGLVPVGTRVRIAEIWGQSLGGWLSQAHDHDGWFSVNDTGGGIFGAHFDLFSGFSSIAKNIHFPDIGHVWFEGIEDRIPYTYTYGLQK
jgi:3D (Asp-Asp-Asp) domain-containing protein